MGVLLNQKKACLEFDLQNLKKKKKKARHGSTPLNLSTGEAETGGFLEPIDLICYASSRPRETSLKKRWVVPGE